MKNLFNYICGLSLVFAVVGCADSNFKGGTKTDCKTNCDSFDDNPKTNRAPTLDSIPNKTVRVGEVVEFVAVGHDPENDVLAYEISTLEGATIDPKSGAFHWQPTATQLGEKIVTVKVTDAKGASATVNVGIFVSNGDNPPSTNYDLCADASNAGRKVLVLNFYLYTNNPLESDSNRFQIEEVRKELATKGFSLDWIDADKAVTASMSIGAPINASAGYEVMNFSSYDQIWVISSNKITSYENFIYAKLKEFYDANKGVAILADNTPHLFQANELVKALNLVPPSSVLFSGKTDDFGGLVTVQKSSTLAAAQAIEHPLFTGLVKFSGGLTLSTINMSLLGANAKLLAVSPFGAKSIVTIEDSQNPKKAPAVLDSGFTKIYDTEINKEGTRRYYRNLACYLAEKK